MLYYYLLKHQLKFNITFHDLGIHPLLAMQITISIRSSFSLRSFSVREFLGCSTIRDLSFIIDNKLAFASEDITSDIQSDTVISELYNATNSNLIVENNNDHYSRKFRIFDVSIRKTTALFALSLVFSLSIFSIYHKRKIYYKDILSMLGYCIYVLLLYYVTLFSVRGFLERLLNIV